MSKIVIVSLIDKKMIKKYRNIIRYLFIQYLATNGILRPVPNAFDEMRNIGAA
jgi:hypothetical protein